MAKKSTKSNPIVKIGTVLKGRNLGELYKIVDINYTDKEYQVTRMPDTTTYTVNGKDFELLFKPHWLPEAQLKRNLEFCWDKIL